MHAASMEPSYPTFLERHDDVNASGVSWGAVIGGAFAAAALSLIMLALGAGFGLSAVSPWSNVGASAATAGTMAIIWLIVTEIVASSMGGYLAGRLRTKWRAIHNDEVHFRDTANGFLVWAVAVVITVAFLATAAASMAGGAAGQPGEPAMGTGESAPSVALEGNAYFVDRLFRSDHAGPADNDFAVRAEAAQVFAHALIHGEASSGDAAYLAQLVAARTGLNLAEAQGRVSDTIADARQAANDVREATAHLLLWVFLALIIGAFCASYAATIGGRQRDQVKVI
jgi:hypothetical protein